VQTRDHLLVPLHGCQLDAVLALGRRDERESDLLDAKEDLRAEQGRVTSLKDQNLDGIDRKLAV